MWLIGSLGLTDVVYMSEKGPPEVVQPLAHAAQMASVPLTTLPSQPTDFASRSSAQLRTMQIQSYFHQTHPPGIQSPLWQDTPMSQVKSISVDYAGPQAGILGIMLMGPPVSVDLLHEVIEGSIVGVVAIESRRAIRGGEEEEAEEEEDVDGGEAVRQRVEQAVTRTSEKLPYMLTGSGSSITLDPRVSYSLGVAMVRKIDVERERLELVTPIPGSRIVKAMRQGDGFILLRGQLDNPNWAISEAYYAARAQTKKKGKFGDNGVRRAVQQTGWMRVEEGGEGREKQIWKLRKRV